MSEAITDDEATVLMIAAEGEILAPIGRWEQPIKALHARGLMKMYNPWNYGIDDAGKAALADREKAIDEDLKAVLNGGNKIATVNASARVAAEESAKHLANAIRTSVIATGEKPEVCARNWMEAIIKRALELQ